MKLSRIEKKELLVRRINNLGSFVSQARWMRVQEIREIHVMLADIEAVLVSMENKE
jgi:hypothetical protein